MKLIDYTYPLFTRDPATIQPKEHIKEIWRKEKQTEKKIRVESLKKMSEWIKEKPNIGWEKET